jgi:hypothetical protein
MEACVDGFYRPLDASDPTLATISHPYDAFGVVMCVEVPECADMVDPTNAANIIQ